MTFPQGTTPTVPQQGQPAGQQVAASQEVEEATFGGGDGLSAPFLKIGPATRSRAAYTQAGEVIVLDIVQIRQVHSMKRGAYDQATGKYAREPQFYKRGKNAGKPIMDYRLVAQTDLRDPAIEGDTGLRTFDLTGMDAFWEPTAAYNCRNRAARLAVEAAGAKGLARGGRLEVCWTHEVPLPGIDQPAINWAMRYTPPGAFVQLVPTPEQVAEHAPTAAPADPFAGAAATPAPAPAAFVPPQAAPVAAQPAAAPVPSWAR